MSTVERINLSQLTREQQNELARGYVTGTGISATPLVNCNRFKTPLRFYHEFIGDLDLPPQKETGAMIRGRFFEPAVGVALVEARPDLRIEKANVFLCDKARRFGGRPDYFLHGDKRGIGIGEFKTAKPSVWQRLYGEPGVAPLDVVAQTLWYAMLAEAAYGLIAALNCDPDAPALAIVEVPRHPAAEARLIRAAEDFLEHVDKRREPSATYGPDRELLNAIYPREQKGASIDLGHDNELIAALHERAELKDRIKRAETRCDEIETLVKDKMREASRIDGLDEFKVTWKLEHRNEYTVAARDTRVLRILDRRDA